MINSIFDAGWYLQQYPDVAAAGVEPLQHYLRFGRAEGRFPCALPALELEKELWQAPAPEPCLAAIDQIFSNAEPLHAGLAAWVLARWYGSFQQWPEVLRYIDTLLQDKAALEVIYHQGPYLLAFSAYLQCEKQQDADALLKNNGWPDTADKLLAQSMLQNAKTKLATLNQLFTRNSLLPLTVTEQPGLDNLQVAATTHRHWLQPLVTVIVPCFNAENSLATALNSLLAQTHGNLQILVADDASTDSSVAVVKQFAAQDKRVTLVPLAENSGAYVARNTALSLAKGKYVTTHDSDDWSHPEKIALQVKALQQNRKAVASVSYWVRCTAELDFQRWRMEDGWVYRNTSSLMFHRKVVKTLGYWDRVSVNADTEYYFRIKRVYGNKSIVEVLPQVPLAFGRADAASLSQTSATHLRTQFNGVRHDYHHAAVRWHNSSDVKQLYLAAEPSTRPFAVPPLICRGNAAQQQHNIKLLLQQQGYFDDGWYLRCYPDVAAAGMDALSHFVRFGAEEGRDPAPDISSSGLAMSQQLTPGKAWLNWLCAQPSRPDQLLEFAAEQPLLADRPVIVCFAHQAGKQAFGAERSFIDVLTGLAINYNIVVCLPHLADPAYFAAVKPFCHKVVLTPYYWWRQGRSAEPTVMQRLKTLLQRYAPCAVYCNTLTLLETGLAARELGIPVVTHVRELPEADPALCQLMKATPAQIRVHTLAIADQVIANSVLVANFLNEPANSVAAKIVIVPNCFDPGLWRPLPLPDIAPYQVAMCSSNLIKKGVLDFVEVARRAQAEGLPLQFNLYGPENDVTAAIQREGMPANLKIAGYQADIRQALAQSHIVLSLSHFQESFGRNVLEAMLLQRVVIAYEWGAVPELLADQRGILVPYKDVGAVLAALQQLCQQPQLLAEYASRAAGFAKSYCDITNFSGALDNVFKDLD